MTNEGKLYEVDTFVAMCEDFMHGKDGDDATKCRRLLAEVIKDLSKLSQATIIKNEMTVCDYCSTPLTKIKNDDVFWCTECGNLYKQTDC